MWVFHEAGSSFRSFSTSAAAFCSLTRHPYDICNAKLKSPLCRTPKIPGLKFQILLRDIEPSLDWLRISSRFATFSPLGAVHENAVRLVLSAADTSPKLVQGRQSEPVGVLNQNYRGIRYIDPHLHHRRGYQDLNLPAAKDSMIGSSPSVSSSRGEFRRNFSPIERPQFLPYSSTFSASVFSLASTRGQIT